jgi:hypothetical protein
MNRITIPIGLLYTTFLLIILTLNLSNAEQSESCLFTAINEADKVCKTGQVAVFVPLQWGNEQLPIYAASIFFNSLQQQGTRVLEL